MTREPTKLGRYIAGRGIIRTSDLYRGQPFAEFPSSSKFFYRVSGPIGTACFRVLIYNITLSMEA